MAILAFAAAVLAAAAFGAQFEPGGWYAALAKPAWTPPAWVFAPVWTVLYVLIALAGWLAWRADAGRAAIGAWIVGLALNGAWSWLFFGLHRIGWALADISLLIATIALFITATWRTSRAAALLFVPYLAWVSFAAALNLAIWRLNAG